MIWWNFLIFCHNILIFPGALLFFGKSLTLAAFLAIPGLLILLINLIWMALLLAIMCARYQDLPQIIASLIQILFYLTPVIWLPSLLPQCWLLSIRLKPSLPPPRNCVCAIIRVITLSDELVGLNWVDLGWLGLNHSCNRSSDTACHYFKTRR